MALAGDAYPLGSGRIPSDLLLLSQGVLPLIHSSSPRLRGGGGKARRLSRRDRVSADPAEPASISSVLRVARPDLPLVRRLEGTLAAGNIRHHRRHDRAGCQLHAADALHILLSLAASS